MWYSSAGRGAPKQTTPVMIIQNSLPSSPCLKMYSRSPVSGSTLETLGAHGGFYTSQHAARGGGYHCCDGRTGRGCA